MYEITIYDDDELDALPDDVYDDIVDNIRDIAEYRNPNSHRNVEKLSSNCDLYKLRVREHRIIFGVASPHLIVFRVKYRGDSDVYRNMEHLERLWDRAQQEVKKTIA